MGSRKTMVVFQYGGTTANAFFQRFIPQIRVEVDRDRMRVYHPGQTDGVDHLPQAAYSTPRLLIGSMTNAVACLNKAVMKQKFGFQFRPVLHLQDMVFLDEEISEVEYRVLEEVGYKAGASEVTIRDRLGKVLQRTYE